MDKNIKVTLITFAAIIICGASFTYGALTAPRATKAPAQSKAVATPKPTKAQLAAQLDTEYPIIVKLLTAAYPKIATDYTVDRGQLFVDGQWYGTTLRYRGGDTANRDTLRVILQKKDGQWVLRTTPPVPLLSAKLLPDVPKDILKVVNQPISLP